MSMSIFKEYRIITKKEMCALLGLNLEEKPQLNFSPEEINKAYKQKILRYHPDKQQNAESPIPIEECTILMGDAKLARDYLLEDRNSVLGGDYQSISFEDLFSVLKAKYHLFLKDPLNNVITYLNYINDNKVVIQEASDKLKGLQKGYEVWIEIVLKGIPTLLKNELFYLVGLSMCYNGQSNLHFMNEYAPYFAKIALYQGINRDLFNEFMQIINNEPSPPNLTELLKKTPLELQALLNDSNKLHDLVEVIKNSNNIIEELHAEGIISEVIDILFFFKDFLTTFPTWYQIFAVYSISLSATATSLPKIGSMLSELVQCIHIFKGTTALVAAALPLALLSLILIPINLSIQISLIVLPNTLNLIFNSLGLLACAVQLILGLSDKPLLDKVIDLVEIIFNLSIGLTLNVLIDSLNTFIYILSDLSPLSEPKETMNTAFTNCFNSLRSKPNETTPGYSLFSLFANGRGPEGDSKDFVQNDVRLSTFM